MVGGIAPRIREMLTAREVVEFYGFHPNRAGYIPCPFHQEKTASLKVYDGDRGWCCFGCHKGGDVISFVRYLFDLDFRQACLRLNTDFRLGLTAERPSRREVQAFLETKRKKEEEQRRREEERLRLTLEYRYWWEAYLEFSPTPADVEAGYIHPYYARACRRLPQLEYMLDECDRTAGVHQGGLPGEPGAL